MEILQKEALKFLKLMENPEFKEILENLSKNDPSEDVRKKLSKLSKITDYSVKNLTSQAKRRVDWVLANKRNIEVGVDWVEIKLTIGNHSCTLYSDLVAPDKWKADESATRAEKYYTQKRFDDYIEERRNGKTR